MAKGKAAKQLQNKRKHYRELAKKRMLEETLTNPKKAKPDSMQGIKFIKEAVVNGDECIIIMQKLQNELGREFQINEGLILVKLISEGKHDITVGEQEGLKRLFVKVKPEFADSVDIMELDGKAGMKIIK